MVWILSITLIPNCRYDIMTYRIVISDELGSRMNRYLLDKHPEEFQIGVSWKTAIDILLKEVGY